MFCLTGYCVIRAFASRPEFVISWLMFQNALSPFLMALHRWISVGSDLKFDARRDLDDVGATCVEGKYLYFS